MKIAAVVITARQSPRLELLARTLLASSFRAEGVELHLVIVDELLRNVEDLVGEVPIKMGLTAIVEPPQSARERQRADKLPAHNAARNAGLGVAHNLVQADYVVLLHDCQIVTRDFVSVLRDCALQGVGYKCKTHAIHDLAVPEDGIVRWRDHHDRLRPVPPMTVAGPCWGAPMASLDAVRGFDRAYDGQHKGHDVDCVIRLARTGLVFVSTERAFSIRLRRTKIEAEITTSKEAIAGARNQQLLNELSHDKTRIFPRDQAADSSVAAPHSAETKAPIAPASRTVQADPVAATLIRQTGSARPSTPGGARRKDDAAKVTSPPAPSGGNGAASATIVDEDKLLDDLGELP